LFPISQPISSIGVNDDLHYFSGRQIASDIFPKERAAHIQGTVMLIPGSKSQDVI
jgi:hypothetical protein